LTQPEQSPHIGELRDIPGGISDCRLAEVEVEVKVEVETHYRPDLDFSPAPEHDARRFDIPARKFYYVRNDAAR
jgi:hypothetical protein